MRRAAVDRDVEHGVRAGGRRQRRAQLALADRDRDRLRAAVEDARDQPLLAQAPGLGGPELVRSETTSLTRSPATAGECSGQPRPLACRRAPGSLSVAAGGSSRARRQILACRRLVPRLATSCVEV